MFTVKKLAISTLLTGSVLFFPAIHAVASVPQHVVKQQAGGYSVQVGDTIITAFTDGSVPQDLHRLTAPDDGGKYRCVTGQKLPSQSGGSID